MTLVVLNPNAHGGRARQLWHRITRPAGWTVVDRDYSGAVSSAVHNGERSFVAAGGDGTVNALLNAIVACENRPPLEEFTLGAVGLGSSNDFHKPGAHTDN